jgi:hypothetical protein
VTFDSAEDDNGPADDDLPERANEWQPYHVYDRIAAWCPVEVAFEKDALVATLERQIAALTRVRDDPSSDDPDLADAPPASTLDNLIARREELRDWVASHDGPLVRVNIYPAFENANVELYRVDAPDNEDGQPDPPPIVFHRLRAALDDESLYWDQLVEHAPIPAHQTLIAGGRAWAEAAFKACSSLQYDRKLETIRFGERHRIPVDRETWRQFLLADPVIAFLSLAVAEHGCVTSAQATARCVDLLEFLVEAKLPATVAAHLSRLAQLYLWGFHSETYVLARSVLEAALAHLTSDDEVRAALGRAAAGQEATLHERIEAAHRLGIFTRGDADLAHEIRQDANDILHVVPGLTRHHASAIDVLRSTARVLRCVLED